MFYTCIMAWTYLLICWILRDLSIVYLSIVNLSIVFQCHIIAIKYTAAAIPHIHWTIYKHNILFYSLVLNRFNKYVVLYLYFYDHHHHPHMDVYRHSSTSVFIKLLNMTILSPAKSTGYGHAWSTHLYPVDWSTPKW